MTRDRLAWAGWGLSLLAVPVTVDILAFATGRESMSRLWARGVLHPVAGPVVAGASAALVWHLVQTVLDEVDWRADLSIVTG